MEHFTKEPGAWIAFGAIVVVLLAIDLITIRGKRAASRKAALMWSLTWVGVGLGFGGFVWATFDLKAAQEYLAAYLIEKSLSLDNVFLFLLIFNGLKIGREHQHKVLFWGILGAVVFRGIFIFLGAAVLEKFEWVSYIFAAILLYAAFRVFRKDPAEQKESKVVAWLSRRVPVTKQFKGGKFLARQGGRIVATPLLVALVAIEITDILLAIDSVPAALSMTRNRFLVYSSNIFAILGLRALYLLLAHTVGHLKYLHYGLALVLGFAAVKIITDEWFSIPPLVSVGIIVGIIGIAIGASLRQGKRKASPHT